MKIDTVTSSPVPLAPPAKDAETAPQAPPAPQTASRTVADYLDLSDEAARLSRDGVSTHHIGHHEDKFQKLFVDLLADILKTIFGREVETIEPAPDTEPPEQAPPTEGAPVPEQTLTGAVSQTSLSYRAVDLSFSGTINTADGRELGFTLDLQYESVAFSSQSAQFQAGPGGAMFNFSGTAAELTSTSFSFTLTSEDPLVSAPRGHGRFNLNNEISSILRETKPLIKEFLAESGTSATFGDLNRTMRAKA